MSNNDVTYIALSLSRAKLKTLYILPMTGRTDTRTQGIFAVLSGFQDGVANSHNLSLVNRANMRYLRSQTPLDVVERSILQLIKKK